MKIGDFVKKKSGYKYVGYIVADFTKTTGERRFVVECKNTGMLHVFNESNLELFTKEESDIEVFFAEIEGTYYLVPYNLITDFWNDYSDERISPLEFDLRYSRYCIEELVENNKIYLKPK